MTMDPKLQELGRRLMVAAPDMIDQEGWLTWTTHAGGYPTCPAGTSLRVDGNLEDAVTEGMFGPITPDVGYRHPLADAIEAQRKLDREAAWARVIPDLSDPATEGCVDALLRRALGEDVETIHFGTVGTWVVWTDEEIATVTDAEWGPYARVAAKVFALETQAHVDVHVPPE